MEIKNMEIPKTWPLSMAKKNPTKCVPPSIYGVKI